MAEIKTGKKRLPINMSFLTHTDSIKTSAQKSPRNFEQPNGVVGLGILVAMNDDRHRSSNPVPILSTRSFSKKLDLEKMEMCEEYTCVVFRVGDNLIKRKEYFEAGILGNDDHGDHKVFASVVTGNSGVSDFLNSCFLCDKMLHGLDIFMYRGEKAFCSAECRYRQISMDERNEKCYSKARKPMEYSVSPCSGALQFLTGVAAA